MPPAAASVVHTRDARYSRRRRSRRCTRWRLLSIRYNRDTARWRPNQSLHVQKDVRDIANFACAALYDMRSFPTVAFASMSTSARAPYCRIQFRTRDCNPGSPDRSKVYRTKVERSGEEIQQETNLLEILDNQMQGICVWNQPSRPEMLSSRHTALIDQAAPKVSTGGV